MNSPARNEAPLTPLQQVTWLVASLTVLGLSLSFSLGGLVPDVCRPPEPGCRGLEADRRGTLVVPAVSHHLDDDVPLARAGVEFHQHDLLPRTKREPSADDRHGE